MDNTAFDTFKICCINLNWRYLSIFLRRLLHKIFWRPVNLCSRVLKYSRRTAHLLWCTTVSQIKYNIKIFLQSLKYLCIIRRLCALERNEQNQQSADQWYCWLQSRWVPDEGWPEFGSGCVGKVVCISINSISSHLHLTFKLKLSACHNVHFKF